jgi:hypothetical protein
MTAVYKGTSSKLSFDLLGFFFGGLPFESFVSCNNSYNIKCHSSTCSVINRHTVLFDDALLTA